MSVPSRGWTRASLIAHVKRITNVAAWPEQSPGPVYSAETIAFAQYIAREIDACFTELSPWSGDNWTWCGCPGQRGTCQIATCTNHKDAPR